MLALYLTADDLPLYLIIFYSQYAALITTFSLGQALLSISTAKRCAGRSLHLRDGRGAFVYFAQNVLPNRA